MSAGLAGKRYYFEPRTDRSIMVDHDHHDARAGPRINRNADLPLLGSLLKPKHELVVLGVSLDHFSSTLQLLICCSGVFVFYLIYGYVQVGRFTLLGY